MECLTLNQSRLPLALWQFGGQGRRLLFLHGFLDGGRSFEDIAKHLTDRYRPCGLDWRGHGASGRVAAGGAYHQLDHLKDLRAVVEELAQADGCLPRLVAHSMGGTIALMLAAFAPDLVDDLVLVDCVGGYPADASTQVDQLSKLMRFQRLPERPFRSFESRKEAEARILQNNPGMTAAGAERMARHYLEEGADGRLHVRLDPRLRGPNPYRFTEEHWLEMFGRIEAKVLLLAPEHGFIHRIPWQGRMERLRSGTVMEFAGGYHHLHVDQPEAVARTL